MMETQQQATEFAFPDLAEVMASEDMQRRMDEAEERVRAEKLAAAQQAVNAESSPKTGEKPRPVSPRNGQPVPQAPKRVAGVKNRLTNLREAVLEAFDQVGGAQYLAKLAEGSSSDRAAFVGLVSKVLPTQINANVEGGVQVQLSWLGMRQIGTTVAQPADVVTQVVDMKRETDGTYRIIDPIPGGEGGQAPAAGAGQEPVGGVDAP